MKTDLDEMEIEAHKAVEADMRLGYYAIQASTEIKMLRAEIERLRREAGRALLMCS